MSWKDKFKASEREREGEAPEEEYEGSLYAFYKGMKWWKTIVQGFKLIGKTYLPTLLIFVGLAIFFSLISTFAMTEWNWTLTAKNEQVETYILLYGNTDLAAWPQYAQDYYNAFSKQVTWNNVVNLFINYFSLAIGGVLTSHYILEKAKGNNDVKLFSSIKHVLRGPRIAVTLLSTLILAVLTAAGFSFYFIFGIVILIMVGLCIPTLVDSELGTKDVLNEGFKLGKDFRLRTTILIIISVAFFSFFGNYLAFVFFPNFAEMQRISWLDPATRNWGMLMYVNIVNYIATAVFQPILFTFLSAHYLELTTQKNSPWFNFMPLTVKEPIEIKNKDIPNITVFGLFIAISLPISIIVMVKNFL
ncbi:MAG: hypothetical protein ACTSRE_14105 [Promethearchaeota archaeon]